MVISQCSSWLSKKRLKRRHEALLRVMSSLIARDRNILSIEEIKQLARKWNQQHCVPPLDGREFEKQSRA